MTRAFIQLAMFQNVGGTDLLLVGGVVLILMAVMFSLKKRRGAKPLQTPAERIDEIKQQRGLRGDLEQLMVEIEQLARRMGSQLDAKTIELERLIDQADARIATLRELEQETARHSGPPASSSAPSASSAPPASATGRGPTAVEIEQRPADPLSRSVYDLADQGHDPMAIARKLDEHIGKVELILALRQ